MHYSWKVVLEWIHDEDGAGKKRIRLSRGLEDEVNDEARLTPPGDLRVLFAGVGGLGVLSAARWLGEAAVAADLMAVVGQMHGMSQRGGSVTATVLIGDYRSSLVGDGEADLLVGLEPLETKRALSRLKVGGSVVVSTSKIVPTVLAARGDPYPDLEREVMPQIERAAALVTAIPAALLAKQAGSLRAQNVVMLGALAGTGVLPFDPGHLSESILARSAGRFAEINAAAFKLGRNAAARSSAAPGESSAS